MYVWEMYVSCICDVCLRDVCVIDIYHMCRNTYSFICDVYVSQTCITYNIIRRTSNLHPHMWYMSYVMCMCHRHTSHIIDAPVTCTHTCVTDIHRHTSHIIDAPVTCTHTCVTDIHHHNRCTRNSHPLAPSPLCSYVMCMCHRHISHIIDAPVTCTHTCVTDIHHI